MWERWNAWDGTNAVGGMNSLNHYAFGSVGEYLFSDIGGINAASPGWQKRPFDRWSVAVFNFGKSELQIAAQG